MSSTRALEAESPQLPFTVAAPPPLVGALHRCESCASCQAYEDTVLHIYEPAILEAARRLGIYTGDDANFAARLIRGAVA